MHATVFVDANSIINNLMGDKMFTKGISLPFQLSPLKIEIERMLHRNIRLGTICFTLSFKSFMRDK